MKKLAAFALAIAALIFTAVPAHAGKIGFSAEPATPSGEIDKSRSRFDYQVEPGTSRTDQIYVMNMGTQPILLTVYANDARSLIDGTYDVGTLDETPTDAGSWVKFANGASSTTIALKNQQAISVPFTLTVPVNAQPGDHVAGIAVQSGGLGKGQIKIAQRIVTRLYARVPGALTPQLTISNLVAKYNPSLNPLDGTVNLSFTINNPGNVALKADVAASATTIFGVGAGSISNAQVEELTPGTSRVYSMSIRGAGQWVYLNPKIVLTPRIDSTAINPGAMGVVEREQALWIFPYGWLAILTVIVASLILWRSRMASRRKQVAAWLEVAEAEAKQKANGS